MEKHLGRRRTVASLPLTGQRTDRNTLFKYEIRQQQKYTARRIC